MYDMPPPPSYMYMQVLPKTIKRSASMTASIIKFPPNGEAQDPPYAELLCSDIDATYIKEIISCVGENSGIMLLIKEPHLRHLEAQIAHVHPLKFLSTIFKDPYLRFCMKDIKDDYLKWSGFMKGLAPNLTKEADKGKLEKHLPDFAADIGVNPDPLRKFFQNRTWEALVRYLMHCYDS